MCISKDGVGVPSHTKATLLYLPPSFLPLLRLLGNLASMSEVTVYFFTLKSFFRLHVVVE